MHREIKTIVFDLDGTIYQNNRFHSDYIRFLLEGTGREDWEEALVHYIEGVYEGRYLAMNRFYENRRIQAASPAETLGLLEGGRENRIYQLTREKMSRDGMSGCKRLREAILALGRRYHTVMLTNSYEETALDFLEQLGFGGIFTDAVFSADKPYGMAENLARRFPELYEEPGSFLTIGDHAFNDLMPLQLRCSAPAWPAAAKAGRRRPARVLRGARRRRRARAPAGMQRRSRSCCGTP